MRKFVHILLCALIVAGLSSCQPTRFVPEGETMLRSVKLRSTDESVNPADFRLHVRQEPNSRWFSLLKVPLGLYSLSPTDTTRRAGRLFRKIGEAPVVYDGTLTEQSRLSLEQALRSRGYLHARVKADTSVSKHRTDLTYTLEPGERYHVSQVMREYDSDTIRSVIEDSTFRSLLHDGMPLDISRLTEERSRLVSNLQNRGYYRINKEYVTFRVDTLEGESSARLTMRFTRPQGTDDALSYKAFRYRDISIQQQGFSGRGLREGVFRNHVALRPDSLYREADIQRTYAALNSLQALSYSTLRLHEAEDEPGRLDADVTVMRAKPHTVTAEVEGTNTNGDLGAAVGLTYSNRNLFRGSEVFSFKLRGAYEAITGLEGYSDENYIEYSAETSLRFPAFRLPFARRSGAENLRLTSDVRLLYNSQNRPEFHRRMLSGEWSYRWQHLSHTNMQHRLDLLSLNYIFMPWISSTFRRDYLDGESPRYSILRSSYENLFIMASAYTFTYSSHTETPTPFMQEAWRSRGQWGLRCRLEIAGNVLYGLSNLFGLPRTENNQYEVFNIAFSQYVRGEADFTRLFAIDERNSLALHGYFGIAIPYGNSSVIPYEKRFFSGGANSVRGWSVRELGPGSFRGRDGKVDFINQTGNMKLDLSAEWRTHLFWKFDGAAFIDAGNVWNTRRYEGQENGQFRWNNFYKQIAVAYGLGLRFNLDYFVLRFDGGMKAVNPAVTHGREHWPVIHPRFSRDFTFHFAVGLPF
ncbi:MAG: BamA/TamA family outer membrane protein [Alloprevotella sp.]|nr:BamA/TamA family outer membrane protein [Alloprevotella sp.]